MPGGIPYEKVDRFLAAYMEHGELTDALVNELSLLQPGEDGSELIGLVNIRGEGFADPMAKKVCRPCQGA